MLEKIISGLAIMMRPLVIYYHNQKNNLWRLLQNMPGLGRDYDILRKDGVNPRDCLDSQYLTPDTRTNILAILDDLETIAPGLLILLRPEFLQIALNHEYGCLPDFSALNNPSSMEEEKRKEFVSNLYAQGTYFVASTYYKENSVELFNVLCGEGNGTWRESMHRKKFGQLSAIAAYEFQYTIPQPARCGDYMVMLIDRGDRSGGWRLVRNPVISKSLPQSRYAWSYDPLTTITSDESINDSSSSWSCESVY